VSKWKPDPKPSVAIEIDKEMFRVSKSFVIGSVVILSILTILYWWFW